MEGAKQVSWFDPTHKAHMAGLIFEPHLHNFENLYIFQDVQMMFK